MKVYTWTGFTSRIDSPGMRNCSYFMAATTKKEVYAATDKKPGDIYSVSEVSPSWRTTHRVEGASNLYEVALASPGQAFLIDEQNHPPSANAYVPVEAKVAR